MSQRRTERLVNLVICLLSTRQYLTASRIRTAVPGYEPADGTVRADEAFKRMFERDKAELRELGIPLETGRNSVFDSEDGYRIARPDYELPDIELEPDEATAVGLATRLWASAGLADAARGALLKLRAAGIDVDPGAELAVEPRVDVTESAFEPCLAAVRAKRAVRFDYRKAGGTTSEHREIEPWGVVSWRGRWYVAGHDRHRGAPRSFRLSRIVGPVRPTGPGDAFTVPPGLRLADIIAGTHVPDPTGTARVRVTRGRAAGLRRHATIIDTDGEYDVLELRYRDPETLADMVVGYGPDAIVIAPDRVRDLVIGRLRESAR